MLNGFIIILVSSKRLNCISNRGVHAMHDQLKAALNGIHEMADASGLGVRILAENYNRERHPDL